MTAFLDLQSVSAGYGAKPVLSGLNLTIDRGQCLWIQGSNGSGKSTLLKTVAGSLALSSGTIIFQGLRIDTLSQVRRHALGIGFMPQSGNIFPSLSTSDFWRVVHGRSREGFDRRCEELLDMMKPLKVDFDVSLSKLSGGQRQLAALGAAVFKRRKLLLLDEPAAGLAADVAEVVYSALRTIVAGGTVCLLVEHEAELARSICTRRISLVGGVVLHGDAGDQQIGEIVK